MNPGASDADENGSPRPGVPVEICSSCRQPLTRRGSGGECLRCLFNFALEADDADHSPAGPTPAGPAWSDGESRRYGHFEIAADGEGNFQELGSGAMGVTYRARDTVLGSTVALKVITNRYASQPDTRARFLREARAAARLRHPNVATVFHYGERAGECFYAMELVEGETLEARVRREGPLPAALALEVGVQVARALVAAEAQGIVHRDLKPSNVMLVAAGHGDGASPQVKVIDFGLAKAVTAAENPGPGDTRAGGFVGTPSFASPEQFAPGPETRVDTRTDIYSLGVTLWFLLCGRAPFVGQTLDEIHAQQTRQALPTTQLHAARVPAPVVTLLRAMLAVDPQDRPGSARELLDALHRAQLQLATASRTRFMRLAGALGLLAFVVLAVAAWRERTRPPTPPPDRSIAVLPFENLSPDPADAFFTTGIQDQITADLARIAALRVTGPDSARAFPPGPGRNLATVGRELGVRYLLEGSARRAGGRMDVIVRLVDLRDPRQPWSGRYERGLADVFAVQGEITRAVADQLQATLSPAEKAAINRPPTTDLAAYDFYLRAIELSRGVTSRTAKDLVQSHRRKLPLLEQAVAHDPEFALAYCELARVHDELHFYRFNIGPLEEFAVDHRALAEAALAKARRLRPDAGELHLAQAIHALQINSDIEQSRVEIDLARLALPNNVLVESMAGRLARRQDHWEEAVRCLERAVTLEPRNLEVRNVLVRTYSYLRRYEDEDRALAGLIALTPTAEAGPLSLDRAEALAESRGDLGPFRAELAAQIASGVISADERLFSETILALLSRDGEALSRALAAKVGDGSPWAGVVYPKAWFEALAARMRGDDAGARTAFAAARLAVEKQVLADSNPGKPLSVLAVIDAGLGRKAEALREAKRACELCTFERTILDAPIVRCNLAVVYAWTGEPDLALAELETLVGRPAGNNGPLLQPTYGDFRLNPLWDPLRADPRFEALVQRLAPDKWRSEAARR